MAGGVTRTGRCMTSSSGRKGGREPAASKPLRLIGFRLHHAVALDDNGGKRRPGAMRAGKVRQQLQVAPAADIAVAIDGSSGMGSGEGLDDPALANRRETEHVLFSDGLIGRIVVRMRQLELDLVCAREGDAAGTNRKHDLGSVIAL